MRYARWFGLGVATAAVALSVLVAPGQSTAQAPPTEAGQTPPPATAWARHPAIASVDVSPDGRHVLAVISPDGGQRILAIWRTAALDEAPFLIGSDDERADVTGARFIKNDRIFASTQQARSFNTRARSSSEPAFIPNTRVLTLQGEVVQHQLRFEGLIRYTGVGSIISELPQDPQSILVAHPRRGDKYKLNLYTGRFERLERGSDRFSGEQADLNGEIRAKQSVDFEGGAFYIAQWIKNPDSGEFEEHFRDFARDRLSTDIVGFSNDPNVIFVRKHDDTDRAAIYEYMIRERRFGEVAFAHPLFDAGGVVRSRAPADFGEIVGFTYMGERSQVFYTDPALHQLVTGLREALRIEAVPVAWTDISSGEQSRFSVGDGADVSLVATSDDRAVVIIAKSGPSTPPEYHILVDGRLRLLGRAYPELADAPLGDTTLIQYAARDDLMIPAFLTKPDPAIHGSGPYPTIVTPHGGPWSRDSLTWDVTGWTQYFAARGYAVLQPQFRGSEGWGQRLWRAGDREWGRKMQDDLDDGVRFLIAEGVADPERVAMHGYSYGGYASMMAAVRPNGLYQCAAAGAGPSTIALFKKGTYNNRFLREFQHPTADGENPLHRVDEVSIPLYLYSGDRDANVLPSESESMAAAMRAAGKPVKLDILPVMGHGIQTWTPDNAAAVITAVEDFFKNDCGPGGL